MPFTPPLPSEQKKQGVLTTAPAATPPVGGFQAPLPSERKIVEEGGRVPHKGPVLESLDEAATFARDLGESYRLGEDVRKDITDVYEDVANPESAMMGSLGTIDRNEGFTFEGHEGNRAATAWNDYVQNDPEYDSLAPAELAYAQPGEDEEDDGNILMNTVNFLFSDELGMMGVKWDEEGFDWDVRHLKNQLVEHPISTAVTIASYAIPLGLAWQKGGKIAARAAKLASEAGDVGAAAGKGLLTGESKLFGAGSLGHKFDDHARLVQTLAKPEANDGAKLFSDSQMKALAKAANPAEIKDIISPTELNKMLIGSFHEANYIALGAKVRAGEKLTTHEKASWYLWDKFGNDYYTAIKHVDAESIRGMDRLFEKAQIGRFLAQAPTKLGDAGNLEVYKYLIGEGGRNTAKLAKKIGKENAEWTRDISKSWRSLLDEQHDAGFIDDVTYEMFSSKKGAVGVRSGAHIPAVKPGTPGFTDVGAVATESRVNQYGKLMERRGVSAEHALTGPTTKHRGVLTTRDKVMEAAKKGEIELDPSALTMGGYVKDNILFQMHRNFVDMITDVTEGVSDKFIDHVMPGEAWAKMGKTAREQWMNFDEMNDVVPGLGRRVQRMINAKAKKEGYDPANYATMPMVSRETVKQFFGHDGSGRQAAGMSSKFFELMTAVHKTSRTSLNPATHMSNIVGNMMFIGMAGANPFSRQMLNDGQVLSKAYRGIAKKMHASDGKKTLDELMTPEEFGIALGKDRYITDKLGTKVDLAEFFSSPAMREMLDAQAFDSVEGLANVKRTLKTLDQLETTGWSSAALKRTAQTIAGVGDAPGIKPLLNHMSSAYLAEDMIPKMMYATHLLRKGWGEEAIVRELGRRMPQYLSVGNLPAKSRKLYLPWITFPAEATRILKNNMMDRPVQSMAWMQAPAIAQSVMSASGLAPDFKEAEEFMAMSPHWAEKYGSVVVEGDTASETLGAIGGAAVGAIGGTLKGGAKGAVMGAIAGATAMGGLGAAVGQDTESELRKFNRTWTMNFLPTSVMTPASTSPQVWNQVTPEAMGGDPTTFQQTVRSGFDLLPVEPLATFTPIMDVFLQRGRFGQELSTKGSIDGASKMALGMIGHLMPPLIQGWGMKVAGEQVNPLEMANIFDHNGGQASLPNTLTATFGGVLAAGTTFMHTKSLPAAGAAGVAGALAGSGLNMKKFLVDFGIDKNPYTNTYSDSSLDGIANNIFGITKSYKASTDQYLMNESFRKRRLAEVRSAVQKDLEVSVASGRDYKVKAVVSRMRALYWSEFHNVRLVDEAMAKWTEREVKGIQKSPSFRGWSDIDLKIKGAVMREAQDAKYDAHTNLLLNRIEQEEQARSVQRMGNTRIIGGSSE